jgi:hypothetical protein
LVHRQNDVRRFKPRADHPEWQRAARYRGNVVAYWTTLAQALLLLDAARTSRDAAIAVAEEGGSPPEAFVGLEEHYFETLWEDYSYDLGFAAEGVHGDHAGTVEDEDVDRSAAFELREASRRSIASSRRAPKISTSRSRSSGLQVPQPWQGIGKWPKSATKAHKTTQNCFSEYKDLAGRACQLRVRPLWGP